MCSGKITSTVTWSDDVLVNPEAAPCSSCVAQTDQVVPDAVKNTQTHVIPDAVRNTQNNECEGWKTFDFFLAEANSKVPRCETAGALWAQIGAV